MKDNIICLTIQDDGLGFDLNKAKPGIGLKNMKSRIYQIDGEIDIVSEKEAGIKISIEVPIH